MYFWVGIPVQKSSRRPSLTSKNCFIIIKMLFTVLYPHCTIFQQPERSLKVNLRHNSNEKLEIIDVRSNHRRTRCRHRKSFERCQQSFNAENSFMQTVRIKFSNTSYNNMSFFPHYEFQWRNTNKRNKRRCYHQLRKHAHFDYKRKI